jgi:hypothetical protein
MMAGGRIGKELRGTTQMKRLFTLVLAVVAAWAGTAVPSRAGAFGLCYARSCGCGNGCNFCVRPFNAFSPVTYGMAEVPCCTPDKLPWLAGKFNPFIDNGLGAFGSEGNAVPFWGFSCSADGCGGLGQRYLLGGCCGGLLGGKCCASAGGMPSLPPPGPPLGHLPPPGPPVVVSNGGPTWLMPVPGCKLVPINPPGGVGCWSQYPPVPMGPTPAPGMQPVGYPPLPYQPGFQPVAYQPMLPGAGYQAPGWWAPAPGYGQPQVDPAYWNMLGR